MEDGKAKLDEYISHRRDRERQVVDAMRSGLHEIPAMVKRIYSEVPEALHPMAERSVLAHLEMLEAEGKVDRTDDTLGARLAAARVSAPSPRRNAWVLSR